MNKREIRIKVTETKTTTYVVETDGDIVDMQKAVRDVASAIRRSEDFRADEHIRCGDIAKEVLDCNYTTTENTSVNKIEVAGNYDENMMAVSTVDRSYDIGHL